MARTWRTWRPRRRVVLAGSVLAAALVAGFLIARGGSEESPPEAQTREDAGASRSGAEAAPDFNLQTVDGRTFSLAAQRGAVVAFDFLEAGCPSCAKEVPVLSELADRFAGRGVRVLIVDVSGLDDAGLRDYYRGELGASTKVLIAADRGFRVARAYQPTAMPQAYVIGAGGSLLWRGTVESDRDGFVGAIERGRS